MSHRSGPDHADVTSPWFGSLALLVLLCRVWRMTRLGFSGRVPSAPTRAGVRGLGRRAVGVPRTDGARAGSGAGDVRGGRASG